MAIDLRAETPTPSAAHLAPSAVQSRTGSEDQQDQQSPPPDYDDQLEDALDKLDTYQSRRAQMDNHLKSAFFNLAQAKQALGPARVGPASFRLGRTEPLMTVAVEAASSSTQILFFRLIEAQPAQPQASDKATGSSKGKGRERRDPVDLRLQSTKGASSSSTAFSSGREILNEKTAAYTSAELHRRPQATTGRDGAHDMLSEKTGSSGGGDTQDQQPPAYADAMNEYLLDPIQQFSAFPPVTLRNAQKGFRKALEESIAVLMMQREFGASCGEVDKLKSLGREAKG